MTEIDSTNIYIGNRDDSALRSDPDSVVVNTAKSVHYQILGWEKKSPESDPHYLSFEDGQLLSFNWVDGDSYLYEMGGPEAFTHTLNFIDHWIGSKEILISCDQGRSRSPTIALLYLAKRLHLISGLSCVEARAGFEAFYPGYPPSGIGDFVSTHWDEIH